MSASALPPGWTDALIWLDALLELEGQNRWLRSTLTTLLFYNAEREELLAVALAAIDARWPETT